MQVTFQLTADDFMHGLLAWRNYRTSTRWFFRAAWVFVCFVFLISVAQFAANPFAAALGTVAPGIAVAVVWSIFLWRGPWLSARRQFRSTPSAQHPMTVEASDSGLHIQSVHGDSRAAWSTYVGWAEEKSVFVILPQPRIYIPIPKRAFTEEELVEFRELLRRNIPAK